MSKFEPNARVVVFRSGLRSGLDERSNIDVGGNIIEQWGGYVVKELISLGHEVYDYAGPEATPKNFRHAINQHNPYTIIIFGHGSECDVWGQDEGYYAPILGVHNTELTRGRVVLVLGCKSAAILGPICIEQECVAYSGYDKTFGFYSIDPYLEGFKNFALELFVQFARGETLGSAQDSARILGERYLAEWRESAPDFISPLARAALRSDINHQVIIGDHSVKIPQRSIFGES